MLIDLETSSDIISKKKIQAALGTLIDLFSPPGSPHRNIVDTYLGVQSMEQRAKESAKVHAAYHMLYSGTLTRYTSFDLMNLKHVLAADSPQSTC